MEEKRDYWTITAKTLSSFAVCFEEAVTKKEAAELFLSGEYEDITDENLLSLEKVVKVG